jgi:hypothetical protein
MPQQASSTFQREQQGTPRCSLLPSATISIPYRTLPCTASPGHAPPCRASSTLQREQQGASCEAPCCRLQLSPRHTSPRPTPPRLASPDLIYSQREQQREPRPPVLLSATITKSRRAQPNPALPSRTYPDLTAPRLIYSPKRAAGNTEVLLAAVCNYCPTLPEPTVPHLA